MLSPLSGTVGVSRSQPLSVRVARDGRCTPAVKVIHPNRQFVSRRRLRQMDT
jgi:hypothetical protein